MKGGKKNGDQLIHDECSVGSQLAAVLLKQATILKIAIIRGRLFHKLQGVNERLPGP